MRCYSWLTEDTPRAANRDELLSCLHQAIKESLLEKKHGVGLGDADLETVSSATIEIDTHGFIQEVSLNASTPTGETTTPDTSFLEAKLNFTDPLTFSVSFRPISQSPYRTG